MTSLFDGFKVGEKWTSVEPSKIDGNFLKSVGSHFQSF